MDRRELVRKVFHNEPSDKLLVAFWHHYLEDERAVLSFDPGGAIVRFAAGCTDGMAVRLW